MLPAVTLSLYMMPILTRMTRSSMLEVWQQDFVRTARAKGLREWRVVVRHSLRAALIPVVTVLGLQVGGALAGAIVTESVFAWPGIGTFVLDAIYKRDYPVVQAAVLVMATLYMLTNLPSISSTWCSTPGSASRDRHRRLVVDVLETPAAGIVTGPGRSRAWRRLLRDPGAVAGGILLALSRSPHSRRRSSPRATTTTSCRPGGLRPAFSIHQGPRFVLGTDQLGRDVAEPTHLRRAGLDAGRRGGGADGRPSSAS